MQQNNHRDAYLCLSCTKKSKLKYKGTYILLKFLTF